jgi:hypothetical protein
MQLAAVRVVAPPTDAQLVVSLAEAKDQLRLSGTADDEHVTRLIKAATAMAERVTHRAIAVQELEATFREEPWAVLCEAATVVTVRLPRAPHLAVLSAVDSGGVDIETLTLTHVGERIDVATSPFVVRYLAGYGQLVEAGEDDEEPDPQLQASYTAAAPDDVKQAVLITVAELYENRTEGVVGTVVGKMPLAASDLLFPYVLFD